MSALSVLSPWDYDIESYGSEFQDLNVLEQPRLNFFRMNKLRREQRNDPVFGNLIRFLHSGKLTVDNGTDCETITMLQYLGFKDDMLDFFWESIGDRRRKVVCRQVVVPQSQRDRILRWSHSTWFAGHLGCFKTFELVQEHFWWPRMYRDVCDYVKRCVTCQRMKEPGHGVHVNHPLMVRPQPQRP